MKKKKGIIVTDVELNLTELISKKVKVPFFGFYLLVSLLIMKSVFIFILGHQLMKEKQETKVLMLDLLDVTNMTIDLMKEDLIIKKGLIGRIGLHEPNPSAELYIQPSSNRSINSPSPSEALDLGDTQFKVIHESPKEILRFPDNEWIMSGSEIHISDGGGGFLVTPNGSIVFPEYKPKSNGN